MNFHTLKKAYQKLWQKKVVLPPYKHIVQLGDPTLRLKSRNVSSTEFHSNEFKQILKNMRYVMEAYDCAGLSAPQLGIDLRLFVISFPDFEKFYGSSREYEIKQMQYIPYTVWINPEMKIVDFEKVYFSEGCESMKGFSADVGRYKKILLTGLNEEGEQSTVEMSGWPARIVQHEMDHLDGKFFLDSMRPHSLICTHWSRINTEGGNIHLSYYPRGIKF